MIIKEGSVRVDLLGGTLDLSPINLVLPNVITLNVATSLKAKVVLEEIDFDGVEVISKDYKTEKKIKSQEFTHENLSNGYFKELTFVALILNLFSVNKSIRLTLESGSPAGAGLGGSSAMGVTIYQALCEYTKKEFQRNDAITKINSIEAIILDAGPAGYQDYYPALYGGILALKAQVGEVSVEQLYCKELTKVLEGRLSLVYSGITRNSGINNWAVYKAFFDKDLNTRVGLTDIAKLSSEAYKAILNKDYAKLPILISAEGKRRKELFPAIVSPEMNLLYNDLVKELPGLGMKVCGAGGGGCFLLVHEPKDRDLVRAKVEKASMTILDFKIENPIGEM